MAQANGIAMAASSIVVNAQALGSSFGGTDTNTVIPALNVPGNYREVTLRSRSSTDIRQYDTWFYQN